VTQALHVRLAELAQTYGLEDIYVFGSRALEIASRAASRPSAGSGGADNNAGSESPPSTGEAPAYCDSDVDIGVQPKRDRRLTARERVRLTLELERALGTQRVDLIILPEANALLAAEVVRGKLLFARDAAVEAETQLYYLRRAGDLAPFYRAQWRDLVGSDL
jgi:predicted nucleotidyltransferase